MTDDKAIVFGNAYPSWRSGLRIGVSYLIRTVTMHYVGRVVRLYEDVVELEDAAWVADTGRFHNALRDGVLAEVEPYVDNVFIQRSCMVDYTEWKHPLPREQK